MAWLLNDSPTLHERLLEETNRLKTELELLGPGSVRTRLAERLRHLDLAAHVNDWLSSPGLRAPH